MSELCGGKQSVFHDIYWLLRHIFSSDKKRCPRCSGESFTHGYGECETNYCTKCHLWEDYNG